MSNYRFNLRKTVADALLDELFNSQNSNTLVAHYLTEQYRVPISRQNVEYWRKQWETSKPKADRELKTSRILREPKPTDGLRIDGKETIQHASRILVIPDLHCPYHHRDAFHFLEAVRNMYEPDVVINLGDETDGHAISFHNSDPNLDSAGVELRRARMALQELEYLFPEMLLCDSNHGSLVYRRAKAHGIPVEMLRTYREILFPEGGGEGWEWKDHHVLETSQGLVLFRHQTSGSVANAAAHEGMNVVAGHNHSKFEIEYGASSAKLYWGATSGCLVDNSSLAFAYGKVFPNKPILGCTVILNGVPMLIPMVLDAQGDWTGII